jgi:hypothetical protein
MSLGSIEVRPFGFIFYFFSEFIKNGFYSAVSGSDSVEELSSDKSSSAYLILLFFTIVASSFNL